MVENEKSIEDYRQNIFLLKTRIAEEEEALARLREEYSPYNLLEDESEHFKLKSKILEGTRRHYRSVASVAKQSGSEADEAPGPKLLRAGLCGEEAAQGMRSDESHT